MRRRKLGFSLGLTALFFSSAPSLAVDATGEWLVNEKVATIRVENCSGRLWGVIAWEKEAGIDSNNPDPSKRKRPTLGMPILLNLQPAGKTWEGKIYNSRDGKTYDVTVQLKSANVLRVEGCLLGFLCGGEDWTRVNRDPLQQQQQKSICANPTASNQIDNRRR